jgi:hypothetical protein
MHQTAGPAVALPVGMTTRFDNVMKSQRRLFAFNFAAALAFVSYVGASLVSLV